MKRKRKTDRRANHYDRMMFVREYWCMFYLRLSVWMFPTSGILKEELRCLVSWSGMAGREYFGLNDLKVINNSTKHQVAKVKQSPLFIAPKPRPFVQTATHWFDKYLLPWKTFKNGCVIQLESLSHWALRVVFFCCRIIKTSFLSLNRNSKSVI